MSDKMWKATIKHAMTCEMGSKIYRYRGPQCIILLNPICKLIKANINGQEFSSREYLNQMNKVQYINHLLLKTHICSINFTLWITLYARYWSSNSF